MASIRKRNWVNKLGNQRVAYECSYTDRLGKRRRKQFRYKRDAEIFLAKTRMELVAGIHTADSASITIGEAADMWIQRAYDENLERSTILQYESFVRLYLKPVMGEQKLSRLTSPMIQHYLNDILKKVSRHKARQCRTHLHSIIANAARFGWIAHNPANNVVVRDDKRHKKRAEFPTKAELRLMLESADEQFRPLLITAIFTGMRISELLGLTWVHVDFDKGCIEVCQKADRVTGRLGAPKSRAGNRVIPMAPIVSNTLRHWQMVCPKGPKGLVFPNRLGTLQHQSNLFTYKWKPLLLDCGFCHETGQHKYKFHSLRHVAASLFIEQGFNFKQLQQIMGHESITITMDTYGHLFEESKPTLEMMAQVQENLLGA